MASLLKGRPEAFSTRQAAGKALKKLKQALPSTPRRRKSVIQQLAKEHGVTFIEPHVRKRLFPQRLDTENVVKAFFERDDISRQLPGRKDFVTVIQNGKKERIQKKILLMNVMEAYRLFKEEHGEIKIGKSKFASLRPKHVCICSDTDQNVCCCIYHENFTLMIEALRKINKDIPYEEELLNLAVCSPSTLSCHLGECNQCPDVQEVVSNSVMCYLDSNSNFTCPQWSKASEKNNVETNFQETMISLTAHVRTMVKHSFIAKHQLKQIKNLKEKLNNEVLLQEDFSENFNIKQQNEIMSAHWKTSDSSKVTLFTAIIYSSKTDYTSYVVVSDCQEKDKYTVATFNRKIFKDTYDSNQPIQHVHVFSDGASGQFKNCFNLSLLTNPKLLHDQIQSMDWSFFATAHGKGPIDGIGGTVKRAVWRRILQQRVIINSASEFAEIAKETCPNIKIFYISKEEIASVREELEQYWNENVPKTIADTRKFHFFKQNCNVEAELEVAEVSMFSDPELEEQLVHNVQMFKTQQKQSSKEPSQHKSVSETSENNSNFTDFEKYLDDKGMVLDGDTPKDGNCFFWALSNQLKEVKQSQIRQSTVNYLMDLPLTKKDVLAGFLTESFDSYVQRMAKDGIWADHVAIDACSEAHQVAITVLQQSGDVVIGKNFDKKVTVGYIPEIQHYVAVTLKAKANEQPIQLVVESYYAVDYVDRFYVGRIISPAAQGFWKMKFLHQHSRCGVLHFLWPERPDTDTVHESNIFFGPVTLDGCLDYTIFNIEDIISAFRARTMPC
ncbi:otu domain-containing protein 5 [Plakobranchus ocellatus]|uniref:Otu domain-containing protein 5 n=1 Tax=Plakobranchus ocellatus TaxID=259542 RepID=A0AAV4B1B8_9GAST|nr:otu domain-containing protein 5 [Plakobranchus ocellatus]